MFLSQRGRSPLHIAASCDNLKVALALLQHAALDDQQQRAQEQQQRAQRAPPLSELLSARQQPFGWTPLHIAAFSGSQRVLGALLTHVGASAGSEENVKRRQPSAVAALVLEAHDATRCTALHHACASGHGDAARLLLQAGAKRTARNNAGQDALAVACAEGRLACIDVVLEHAREMEQQPVSVEELRLLEKCALSSEVLWMLQTPVKTNVGEDGARRE